jgi:hypothetical protein
LYFIGRAVGKSFFFFFFFFSRSCLLRARLSFIFYSRSASSLPPPLEEKDSPRALPPVD